MRIAVLTMTRDRLAYTEHSFRTLRENAGCAYHHHVLDQGSTDGTQEWLRAQTDLRSVTCLDTNVGICRGANLLLDGPAWPADYDVIVRFDNDCDVTTPGTLKTIARLAWKHSAILGPRVLGLLNPPPILGAYRLDDYLIEEPHHMGGIFMAIPARAFTSFGFRFDPTQPVWGGDELICPWWRSQGGKVGYVAEYTVGHYETTNGQRERFPDYFARKDMEFA